MERSGNMFKIHTTAWDSPFLYTGKKLPRNFSSRQNSLWKGGRNANQSCESIPNKYQNTCSNKKLSILIILYSFQLLMKNIKTILLLFSEKFHFFPSISHHVNNLSQVSLSVCQLRIGYLKLSEPMSHVSAIAPTGSARKTADWKENIYVDEKAKPNLINDCPRSRKLLLQRCQLSFRHLIYCSALLATHTRKILRLTIP